MEHWSPGQHKCLQRNDRRYVPEEVPQDVWSRVESAKELILDGVVKRRSDVFLKALRMMYNFPFSKEVISHVGLDVLFEGFSIWMIVEDAMESDKVQNLVERWRKVFEDKRKQVRGQKAPTFWVERPAMILWWRCHTGGAGVRTMLQQSRRTLFVSLRF